MYRNRLSQIGLGLLTVVIMAFGCVSKKPSETTESKDDKKPKPVELLGKQEPGKFLLQGIVENSKNELVVLQEFAGQQLTFKDTTRTDSLGRYIFHGVSNTSKFYYVTVKTNQPPGVPVILENDKEVKLFIVPGELIETQVDGDAENMKMKELYNLYMSHNKESKIFNDRVNKINPNTASDSLKNAITLEYSTMQARMRSDIEGFIDSNKGMLATYFAVSYVVSEPSIEMLENALIKMKTDLPMHEYTIDLENRINSIKPLSIGAVAPDIELLSPEGELIKLSSLRGKVVLIDFWASWCGPCRKENPNVVKVYKKYNHKGFEIFGVSLDNNKELWKSAIAKDELTWVHVSDLKGWQSSAAALYKVTGIPKTILLDKKGRILAMDLRGPHLEAKLAEIFD